MENLSKFAEQSNATESGANAVSNFQYTDSFSSALERSREISTDLLVNPSKYRVLTGDRPTGALHVGHYFGTLQNRVRLQDLGVDVWVLVADFQVMTDRDSTRGLDEVVLQVLFDYLAIGIDPESSHIFAHSYIPELNQLLVPFLGLVSVSEMQRNPTVKEEIRQSGRDAVSGLMMTYPIHQAADILFCHGNLVPGGKDQLPHIEIARAIARRFNERYRPDYFPEPDLLVSNAPLLLGTDGRKMGKSLNNSISIRSTADETRDLIAGAKTDSERFITYDPSNRPEVSNLLLLGSLCLSRTPEDLAEEIGSGGAHRLKYIVTEAVNEYFREIRARRVSLARDSQVAWDALRKGCNEAREVAAHTLEDVRQAMDMAYFKS